MNSEVRNLLKNLKSCKNNRCDYILEHSEIDCLLEYIEGLQLENQGLKDKLQEAIENSNKLLKFINQNFMSNDSFKQFSFKDLLKIKGYCDESLEMLIGTI